MYTFFYNTLVSTTKLLILYDNKTVIHFFFIGKTVLAYLLLVSYYHPLLREGMLLRQSFARWII